MWNHRHRKQTIKLYPDIQLHEERTSLTLGFFKGQLCVSYLFFCWWILSLPPFLGYCEKCCCEHGSWALSQLLLHFLWIYFQKRGAALYCGSIFNFLVTSTTVFSSCSSVTKSCPTLCDPRDCSTPGFPVLHNLPEFAQIQIHWVSDAV